MERLQDCFSDLADPRTGNATRYGLLETLTIALCATLSGTERGVDMALFGKARRSEPRHLQPEFPPAGSGGVSSVLPAVSEQLRRGAASRGGSRSTARQCDGRLTGRRGARRCA